MHIQNKMTNLWLLFILGGLIHTMMELLPLFFVSSIVVDGGSSEHIMPAVWFTLIMYMIPMLLILAIQFIEATWLRVINLVAAVIALLLNISHPAELFEAPEINIPQLILMSFLIVLSVLLTSQSWKWFKTKPE